MVKKKTQKKTHTDGTETAQIVQQPHNIVQKPYRWYKTPKMVQ